MKKLLLLVFVFVAATVTGFAQTAPRTEYSVSISESTVKIKPGETKQITVSILKSKSYTRFPAKLGLSSSLPAGITVTYEPAEGTFESSVATITAASDVKAGEYQIILKTTVNNKAKGSIVKIVVENGVDGNAVSVN